MASGKDLVTESEVDGGNVMGKAVDAGSTGAQQYHLLSFRQRAVAAGGRAQHSLTSYQRHHSIWVSCSQNQRLS